MPPDTLRYALIMLAAGIGIPILAALNAQLGSRICSPAAAATVLFIVAVCAAAVTMMVTAGPAPLAQIPGQPPHLLLAGLPVAFQRASRQARIRLPKRKCANSICRSKS
jgi:bacterial/archaeal transporter family-2 protein